MQIFISWSGKTSKKIAKVLKDWIPLVLQTVKPYYTPEDIDKGVKWQGDILSKLEQCQIGIICLTPENLDKPWILFEAGALSSRLDNALVCPIVFDLKKANVKGPLGIFQTTEFIYDDFKHLLLTINNQLNENKVPEKNFDTIFDRFFPDLEKEIKAIIESGITAGQEKSVIREDREILEEILENSRRQLKIAAENKAKTQHQVPSFNAPLTGLSNLNWGQNPDTSISHQKPKGYFFFDFDPQSDNKNDK